MSDSAEFYRDYDNPKTRRKLRAYANLVKASYAKYGNRVIKPRILDIGCASGNFLGYLDASGLDTFGIDISPYMIEQTKRFTKAKTVVYDIQGLDLKLPFNEESFDIVTMFSVIAHIRRPLDALDRVH